jgi:hypothetical protein
MFRNKAAHKPLPVEACVLLGVKNDELKFSRSNVAGNWPNKDQPNDIVIANPFTGI